MLKKQPEVTDLKSVTECKYDRLQKDYTRFNMAIPEKKPNKGRGEKGLRTVFFKKAWLGFQFVIVTLPVEIPCQKPRPNEIPIVLFFLDHS